MVGFGLPFLKTQSGVKMNYIIKSSNKHKIAEYRKLIPGIKVEKGADKKEIYSTDEKLIVAYKCLDERDYVIVEDSTLMVNGILYQDIKWKQNELKPGDKVRFIVSLAYKVKDTIKVFQGYLDGVITTPKGNSPFGFDNIFLIPEVNKTIGQLKETNPELYFSTYNPRAKAIKNLLSDSYIVKYNISKLPPITIFKFQNQL